MTATVCKKCKHFIQNKNWCTKRGVFRTPWDTMCEEGLLEHGSRVDAWLDGHGKGRL
jgi:hypothetical protein